MGIIVDVGADTLSVESLETPGQVSSTALVYTHATTVVPRVPGHHVHCQSVLYSSKYLNRDLKFELCYCEGNPGDL